MHTQINGPSPVAIIFHIQYKHDIYTYDTRNANKAHTQFYHISSVANTCSCINKVQYFSYHFLKI